MRQADAVPCEAERALALLRKCFGDALRAVFLHGSAVAGGLRPNSDVDVIAVVDRPTTHALRSRLLAQLMRISGHPGRGESARPLELILFFRDEIAEPSYPARAEFVYGEWLRLAFEAGEVPEPASDPEYTLVLAQARQKARSLFGADPAELLPIIPKDDLRRAIGDALPALLASLEGDERNVLLTLARMWNTLATGEIVPKDVAAEWAMARLGYEEAALVGCARDAYLSAAKEDWHARKQEVRRVANSLGARISAML